MKRRSKASARRRSIVDPTLEKPLLHLHAATDIDSFWHAVQQTIEAALPTCFIGLTLQHTPILPRIARSTGKLPGNFFPSLPIEKYFSANPHRKLCRSCGSTRPRAHPSTRRWDRVEITPLFSRPCPWRQRAPANRCSV